MKVTAQDLLALGVINRLLAEPLAVRIAHWPRSANLHAAIVNELEGLAALRSDQLTYLREKRILRIGRNPQT